MGAVDTLYLGFGGTVGDGLMVKVKRIMSMPKIVGTTEYVIVDY